jgi:nucleoside-diphosphate-sugar epimerase
MKKKVLITGGAGFIGASIVTKLIHEGYAVKVLDNLQRGKLSKLNGVKGEFEFIKCDIRDTKKVVKASTDCTSIIHLAYVNGTKFFYSNPDMVLDIGINGMISVVEACKLENIEELFLASSSEVYQNPTIIPTPEEIPLVIPDPYNPRFSYGGGKILSELMAIHVASKTLKKTVIFRPHNIYGPDMGTEHAVPELILKMARIGNKKTKFKIQGNGSETRSYMYIDDFAAAFFKVFTKAKNLTTFNIGNEDEISSHDLTKKIAKVLDKKIEIVTGKLRAGSTPRRCPDISKIKKLGYRQNVSLENGLIKTAEWYINSL